jgi:hypothetical protein
MPLDISAETFVAAAPADVAAVMFDPAREPEWVTLVTGVELIDPALAPGARAVHRAKVMGRDVSWTTEVEAVHFPHLLSLRVTGGPFSGAVQFHIQRSGEGSAVRIRGVGDASAVRMLPASMLAGPIKAELGRQLARLKAVVEREKAATRPRG